MMESLETTEFILVDEDPISGVVSDVAKIIVEAGTVKFKILPTAPANTGFGIAPHTRGLKYNTQIGQYENDIEIAINGSLTKV